MEVVGVQASSPPRANHTPLNSKVSHVTIYQNEFGNSDAPMLARLRLRRPCASHIQFRFLQSGRAGKEDPRWPGYEVVIGIETHAQLKSRQKLFSRTLCRLWFITVQAYLLSIDALTSGPKEPPNTNVSVFDAAFPGTLPVRHNKLCRWHRSEFIFFRN